jgi:hypothetical protein
MPVNIKSYSIKSLIDPTTWAEGEGSATGFSANGAASENHRFMDTDPFGLQAMIWEARNDSTSDADGGWNGSWFNIDNTKLYRFSVWVNRTVQGNGSFYFGLHGGNSGSSNIGVLNRSNGSNNTNPYFWATGTPTTVGEWTLVVGHVWPAGSGTGANHTDSGRYTIDGGRVGGVSLDFVWNTTNATALHRTYLYYSTDTTTRQRWVYPRVDIVDGTEPSIDELLASPPGEMEVSFSDARELQYDSIVQDGLVLHLDAATFNTVTGTTWYNIANTASYPNGTQSNPFVSPKQAQDLGYSNGTYWFKGGSMTAAEQLEFVPNYYEGKPFCCVFRSPYNSTATTNKLDLAIPMAGFLVQRDTLDLRAAVYWSTPITYATTATSGDNTADSGYSPRRVILGYAGGHGIYTTGQQACNWPNGAGAIGAGWNGSTCGSFPNGLLWGTGQSSTATYTNMSGTWSHWVYWEGGDSGVNGGTLTNGPVYNSASGGGIVFDQVNDYANFGSPTSLNLTQDLTLESFIYPTSISNSSIFTWASNYTTFPFHHTVDTGYIRFNGDNGGNHTSSTGVSLNQWSHVVVTVTGTIIDFYLNATKIDTKTLTVSTRNSGDGILTVGGRLSSQFFGGTIAVGRIYNRALSPAEIEQNYNVQKGRFGVEAVTYEYLTFTADSAITVTEKRKASEYDLVRTGGTNGWNAHAYSNQAFTAPCTIEFYKLAEASDNGKSYAMIGWNVDPTANSSYTNIDIAAYPYRTSDIRIYTNGTHYATPGAWDPEKRFYMTYDTDGNVRLWNGETLLYTYSYGTGKTVYIDTSFYITDETYNRFSEVRVTKKSWNGSKYV